MGYTGTANTGVTELYNGSTWTSAPGTASPLRGAPGGAGVQTAAVFFGGFDGAVVVATTQEFNGATFSPGGNLNTARSGPGRAGTQTAALAFGGGTPSVTAATEEYNGSTWTAVSSMNIARSIAQTGGDTISSAIAAGGSTPSLTTASETYNGTVWSSTPPISTARQQGGGASAVSSNTGLIFGGQTATAYTAATEEWSGPQTTITASTLTTS
jgi:hypothetical protein